MTLAGGDQRTKLAFPTTADYLQQVLFIPAGWQLQLAAALAHWKAP
ncbi:MAG TPA: hypothetical protein VFG50_09890 [Rhodothermales bacterium]|nr:hypothetical protein [Rhodothermales bacterium]